MISRRHIRLKVMQSLYSYFSSSSNQASFIEKEMLKGIRSISELHLILISFIIELNKYANEFLEINKSKHLPSSKDLDTNRKFVNNRIVVLFKENEDFMRKSLRVSGIWKKGDLNIIRKVFVEMIKSEQYRDYLKSEKDNFSEDQKFIQILLSDFILENDIFHHILQERSIFWMDDLPFISVFLKNQINFLKEGNSNIIFVDVFKNEDDKKFAIDLFRKTIFYANDFEKLIEKKAKNWDLDRIANMDILIIKMALAESIEFKEIPIKVTFNEYIEIAKYYSTENSKMFINGILDKIVSQFKSEGKINKIGRGLI